MDDDRLSHALEVLTAAGRLPESERVAFLARTLDAPPEAATTLAEALRVTAAPAALASALREAFDQRTPPPLAPGGRQQVGDTIGKYRLEELLGEGGMGQVFVGRDEALGRTVAIKTIRADIALAEAARQRFHREARILSHLEHPHICRLYDAFAAEGTDVLVLERIEGRPLSAVLGAEGALPLARVLDLARQVCEALLAAHATGIVHRDLKPANVMLQADGHLKVLDFGIARAVDAPAEADGGDDASSATLRPDTGPELTEQGAVLGTLLYMSPEQAQGDSVGPASDLFALGLLIVEMATGASPRPPHGSRGEALDAARSGRTVPLDDLPRVLRPLVASLLDPAPARRPDALRTLSALRDLAGAPARRRRRLIVGAVLAAFLAFGWKYVVDLDARRLEAEEAREDAVLAQRDAEDRRQEAEVARADAERARDAADARRAQAEDLFGFAVGDLFDRLGDLGRLDLLEGLAERALQYVEAIPPGDMTDEELHGHVRNLYQLGEVRFSLNDLDGARALYATSVDLGRSLVARDPDNGPWLKALGAAEFYVGQIAFEQGRLDQAETSWVAYLDIAEQLVALDPGDQEWQIELAYAHTNLAAIHQARGENGRARQAFEQVVARWEVLLAGQPDNDDHRYELADALSWLGEALLGEGRLQEAGQTWERERALREELLRAANAPVVYQLHLAEVLNRLAGVEEQRDQLARGAELLEEAADATERLHRHDPRNARWLQELCRHLVRAAENWIREGNDARAARTLERVAPHLERLTRDAPDQADVALLTASWSLQVAVLTERTGELEDLAAVRQAVERIDQVTREHPGLRSAARVRVGAWELLARRLSRREQQEQAEQAWEQVLVLTEGATDLSLLTRRRKALAGLGRDEEAEDLRKHIEGQRADG